MPPLPTSMVLDIQSGRVITDGRLQSGIDLQDAAAIRKLTLDWDEPAAADRIVRFSDPGRDAEVAYKHEVEAGWKEVLLSAAQLVNGGIQPAVVFGLSGLPVNNETLIFHNDTDGFETFTWKSTAAAPFEVQIGGDVPTSLANLAAQVSADSVYWGANVYTNLTSIAATVVAIRKLVPDDGDNDRAYGSTSTGQVVDFGTPPTDLDYANEALTALPVADPVTRNFGISRGLSSLYPGEQHLVLAEDEQFAWDADAVQWNQIGIVVPVATSGPGGAVVGKLTMDENFALEIAGGVAKTKVDGITIIHNGAGELQSIGGGGGGGVTGDASVAPTFTRDISGVLPPNPGTIGVDTDTLDYPSGVDRGQRFEFVVPDDYAGGDLTILAVFAMGSVGAAGTLRVQGQAEVFDVDAGGITPLAPVDYDFVPPITTNIDQEPIFAVPNINVTSGDTVQLFVKRIGTWVGETDTRDWRVISYQIRYTSQITNRAKTISPEVLVATDEPAPTPGTIGTDTDTEDYPTGSDAELKLTFNIPDEWDQATPPALRLVYAMSSGAGGIVRIATEGEVLPIGGTPATVPIKNADLTVPASTNIDRSLIIREIDPLTIARGDAVTLKIARRVAVGGNSAANFRLIAVTITFANVAEDGFTTVQTEEKFLELGIFSNPADIDIYGDTAYPVLGGDFLAMDRMFATSNGKRMDIAYMGRIAAYQFAGLKSLRISLRGVNSAQYKLKIYTATGGATPIYDSSGGGAPAAVPPTLTETVLTSPADFVATTANEVYHVVVEAYLDNTDEIFVSRPWVRHE